MSWFCYAVDKIWPAVVTIPVAVGLTQWAAQKLVEERKPKLELVPEEHLHSGGWGPIDDSGRARSFHSWRIKIQHTKIPRFLGYLIKGREPAFHCKAYLTFYDSKGDKKFIMQGRWANTPEPSRVLNVQEKILYPDTVDIGFHDDEPTILDCIHKFDDSEVTYGWNNISYAFNGMAPYHKLEVGTYTVHVKLSAPNIRPLTTKFDITVSENWQETSLTPTKDPQD
jgi:hypothetical protein